MMTPAELREYEFKGAGRNAYKSDDVDEFFATVAIAYEKMYRENAELVKRVSLLADRLEQYKQDETDIKQAVLSAQKAADLIVKEAESSVEDSKTEAEAILAAAKGEADIIKSDAEKQAVADADLLLSVARDKAEAILNKAKEEAHGILIKANESASNTVGAANRTITSESLHYDMLKKEVSEFRASILSQYKAHIEMISKLPEIADEKAAEIDAQKKEDDASLVVSVEEEAVTEEPQIEYLEFNAEEVLTVDEFVEDTEADVIDDEEDFTGEEVVKTTLPYDFFEEDTSLEFVDDNTDVDFSEETEESAEGFALATDDLDFESDFSEEENEDNSVDEAVEDAEETETEPEDIPISKGFNVDAGSIDFGLFEDPDETTSLFDAIEKIDDNKVEASFGLDDDDDDNDDDDGDEPKSKFGFFRRKK